LEYAGAYRHYHAALMQTFIIGKPDPEHIDMHKAAKDALLGCEAALMPGKALGDVFSAHAKILDDAGFGEHRLNACGYSMGARFAPNWMDWPMLYANNPVEAQAGMSFFIHIIIVNSKTGHAQTLGRSSIVTETGTQCLSALSLDLVVKG
jgi:Xaa-Pro dipeptidase